MPFSNPRHPNLSLESAAEAVFGLRNLRQPTERVALGVTALQIPTENFHGLFQTIAAARYGAGDDRLAVMQNFSQADGMPPHRRHMINANRLGVAILNTAVEPPLWEEDSHFHSESGNIMTSSTSDMAAGLAALIGGAADPITDGLARLHLKHIRERGDFGYGVPPIENLITTLLGGQTDIQRQIPG